MKKKNFLKLMVLSTIFFCCAVVFMVACSVAGEEGKTGPQGEQGEIGPQGNSGVNGSIWLTGEGLPINTLGSSGDLYLDSETCNVYKKNIDIWEFLVNIKGVSGMATDGTNGIDGVTWLTGEGVPESNMGLNNDLYFDIVTCDIYKKMAGEWGKISSLVNQTQLNVLFIVGQGNMPTDFSDTIKVKYGENISRLPIPTSPFGDFLGWYTTTGGKITINDSQLTTLTPITRHTVVTAKWTTPETSGDYTYGDFVFTNATELKKYNGTTTNLVLEEGITKILPGAFDNAVSTTTLTIPKSVSLSASNFKNNTTLVKINVLRKGISISSNAFESCTKLEEVVFNGVSDISNYAFYNCKKLETVRLNNDNDFYSDFIIGTFAFGNCEVFKFLTNYIAFSGGIQDISDTKITYIGDNAFKNCYLFNGLNLEDVTYIGDYAFSNCNNITSITIGDTIYYLGFGIFENWTKSQHIFFRNASNIDDIVFTAGWNNNCNATIRYL